MTQLTEMDRSRLRIASLMLQHCRRFRLVEAGHGCLDAGLLISVVSDLLDDFEGRLPDLCDEGAAASNVENGTAGPRLRTRKHTVAFPKNRS